MSVHGKETYIDLASPQAWRQKNDLVYIAAALTIGAVALTCLALLNHYNVIDLKSKAFVIGSGSYLGVCLLTLCAIQCSNQRKLNQYQKMMEEVPIDGRADDGKERVLVTENNRDRMGTVAAAWGQAASEDAGEGDDETNLGLSRIGEAQTRKSAQRADQLFF